MARRLNEALVKLQLDPSQLVLTTDIGCVGLVDPLFPGVHTVHTIHGRSTAVAAGAVLADALVGEGRMKNIVMIGDGGATIGLLHLTQAALLNVDLTVVLSPGPMRPTRSSSPRSTGSGRCAVGATSAAWPPAPP